MQYAAEILQLQMQKISLVLCLLRWLCLHNVKQQQNNHIRCDLYLIWYFENLIIFLKL
jgi:hypothetical protein